MVYAALGGNVAIAAAKLGAYALSGSSAMLTEAVHSLVDSVDQVLLLIGQARGRRAPDTGHPLGHGMESYFWSFVVAVMVLLLGGVASLYQGVHRLFAPAEVVSPGLSFAVLGLAAVFEGSSLAVGFREYKRLVRGRKVKLWTFIRVSKDPSLYATLLEDSAALIGIAVAALGVLGTGVLHLDWADGAASLGIGVLLTLVAGILANETRSLIAGEAVAPRVAAEILGVLKADTRIHSVVDIATLHLGPRTILVALTLVFTRNLGSRSVSRTILDLTDALRRLDARIAYVYVRPPPEGSAKRPLETAARRSAGRRRRDHSAPEPPRPSA